MPLADVIIVSYFSGSDVGPCIGSVRADPCCGRVIVVDNASEDGSAKAARAAGADVVIENRRNEGFARAVNRGFTRAGTDQVLLLNPDARIESRALGALCATLRREPRAAIAAPLLRDRDGAFASGAGRFATVTLRVGLCLPLVGRVAVFAPEYPVPGGMPGTPCVRTVDYAFGAAMLIDSAFLSEAGGLDERYFLFAEDEDLCRTARGAGRRVLLDAAAVVRHEGGASSSDPALTEAQRLFSTFRLLEKWEGPRAAARYAAGVRAASRARLVAARVAGRREAATEIARLGRLFARSIRTGADPLVEPLGSDNGPDRALAPRAT